MGIMYGKIVNPLTGRQVSIYGKLGQQVIRNYINQLGGQDTCGFDQNTLRCSKKADGNMNNWCELSEKGRCRKSEEGKGFAPRNPKNVQRGRKLGLRIRKPNKQNVCGFNDDTMRCSKSHNGTNNKWCMVSKKNKCKKNALGRREA